MENYFDVFVRNWWKRATTPGWPNGLEPDPRARKTYLRKHVTYVDARAICDAYNGSHTQGRLSRKAEFESV